MKLKDVLCIILSLVSAFFASTSFFDFLLKAVICYVVIDFVISFLYSSDPKDIKSKQDNNSSKITKSKSANIPTKFDEKIIKKYKFNVKGVTFECKLDKNKRRQEILTTCKIGEELTVGKYLYKGEPAYLLVTNGSYKYDIGAVPADVAEEIGDKYAFKKRVAYIENIDTFVNEHDKTIIYAKVILYILDKSSSENDECII